MKTSTVLLIAAGLGVLYIYTRMQSAVQVSAAPLSNANGQTLWSPSGAVGNGGTTSGLLTQAGLVAGSSFLADLTTLTQPNAQNSAGSAAPGYAIQTSAATPYSNGPTSYYQDAYNSSPPDPSYTASLLTSDPDYSLDS